MLPPSMVRRLVCGYRNGEGRRVPVVPRDPPFSFFYLRHCHRIMLFSESKINFFALNMNTVILFTTHFNFKYSILINHQNLMWNCQSFCGISCMYAFSFYVFVYIDPKTRCCRYLPRGLNVHTAHLVDSTTLTRPSPPSHLHPLTLLITPYSLSFSIQFPFLYLPFFSSLNHSDHVSPISSIFSTLNFFILLSLSHFHFTYIHF